MAIRADDMVTTTERYRREGYAALVVYLLGYLWNVPYHRAWEQAYGE